MRGIAGWRELLEQADSALYERLAEDYGSRDLTVEPARLLRECIDAFAAAWGEDRPAFVVRTTGRVNLLGMHVDHRGGAVNPVAIKEAFAVVGPRDDDRVVVRDIRPDQYPEESFSIGACLPRGERIADWNAWCHDELERRQGDSSVTHSAYVRSGVLYFQHLHTRADGQFEPAFKGMDMVVGSNVPPAAGLSTSSCVVVASALAVLHVNGVEIDPMAFCEHCGPAEWYVGTRGGFGDHAAIRMGRANTILHMGAFPFSVRELPFPADYRVVLADSQVEAKKRTGARDAFNLPIAAYTIGLWLARRNFPQYADRMEYLRDLVPQRLGVSDADVLRIIRSLPESASRAEILALLPDQHTELEGLFRTHGEPAAGYRVREVCLYGVAECARSDLAVDLLGDGDVAGFGRLITLHHEGDRRTRLENGEMVPVQKDYSDARLDALIADAEGADATRREAARVWNLPGGYNVSVPETDRLVDLALQCEGVMGAGIIGAGLGGSIAALVRAKDADAVVRHLAGEYYAPAGLPVTAEIVAPVGGAHVLDL